MKRLASPFKLYTGEGWRLYYGDALKVLPNLPANSIDSCVTDPPYGLEFMGKEWDTFSAKAGANIEANAKSAGGFGADAPTNVNAYGAARVRYGKLFTERPEKIRRRAEGRHDPCDRALPVYVSGGTVLMEWHLAWANEVYRVLKPGAFILAFGGSRTYHWLAAALELAGFEIRDQIEWIYGSGFPKSTNVKRAIDMSVCELEGRHYEVNLPKEKDRLEHDHVCPSSQEGEEWEGWGTALKPAHEPICMARKPLGKGNTVARNVMALGTGALNVGACRVDRDAEDIPGWHKSGADGSNGYLGTDTFRLRSVSPEEIAERNGGKGRWPSNVILSHDALCTDAWCSPVCPVACLDKQSGVGKSSKRKGINRVPDMRGRNYGTQTGKTLEIDTPTYEDSGGASRFFYCAKPSKAERDRGLDELPEALWVQWQTANGASGKPSSISEGRNTKRRNTHPTVKPTRLMAYLIKLVTPPGGDVLDLFSGSGSTGVAAIANGYRFTAIEKGAEYLPLSLGRLRHAEEKADDTQVFKKESSRDVKANAGTGVRIRRLKAGVRLSVRR